MVGASIKRLGYEVFEAAMGPEAINKASSMRPDLIIMDLRLPGMNGDEATARLKKNLSTRNIPVIISTAWTTMCNIGDSRKSATGFRMIFGELPSVIWNAPVFPVVTR